MLDCLPIYHWFHCGNPYSGAQGGMRYLVAPAKKADPADESGKRKIEYLTATISVSYTHLDVYKRQPPWGRL